ncbi:sodium:solute symporter family transporter [Pseudoalteromonas sp. SSMSWG5]|uniref:sodium:solute symporter family transporter n=1 Tax=Pseudoalteromonas sp. SSMSWG5 TaxID=3139396 RepID=UPI003BA96CFA
MHLWLFLIGSLLVVLWLWLKSNKQSSDSLITANKNVPWYLAGSSMSATTLSSDTPIIVAGLVYSFGISGNWIWWVGILSLLSTAFFFSKYWYRSGIKTEVELYELRYGDSSHTRFLRKVKAIFEGGILNAIVLASLTYAFSIILSEVLIQHPILHFTELQIQLCIFVVFLIVVMYTALSGLKGVIITDIFQLFFAVGISWVALYFILESQSLASIIAEVPEEKKNLFLDNSTSKNESIYFWIFLVIAWIYKAPGSGPLIQRVISCKSESDAKKAILMHCVIHFFVRSIPWILIGVVAITLTNTSLSADQVYAHVIMKVLPPELINLFIFCLIAAYISTVDSHLNWGASLITNDFYIEKKPKLSKKNVYFLSVLALSIISYLIYLLGFIDSLLFIYQLHIVIFAGLAPFAIGRWFWWKITLNAEILGYLSSITLGVIYFVIIPKEAIYWFSMPMLLNLSSSLIILFLLKSKAQLPDKIHFDFFNKIGLPLHKNHNHRFSLNKKDIISAAKDWIIAVILFSTLTIGVTIVFIS